jgi:hypothetical protein
VKKPAPVALLTFIPVLLLALLRPDWLTGTALLLAVLVDVAFFRDVTIRLRDLIREDGAIPYKFRYPFFPLAAGLVGYGAISFGYVPSSVVAVMAIASASLIAVSKLWISSGPLWPYGAKSATA